MTEYENNESKTKLLKHRDCLNVLLRSELGQKPSDDQT